MSPYPEQVQTGTGPRIRTAHPFLTTEFVHPITESASRMVRGAAAWNPSEAPRRSFGRLYGGHPS